MATEPAPETATKTATKLKLDPPDALGPDRHRRLPGPAHLIRHSSPLVTGRTASNRPPAGKSWSPRLRMDPAGQRRRDFRQCELALGDRAHELVAGLGYRDPHVFAVQGEE